VQGGKKIELGNYRALPRVEYSMSVQDNVLNLLANPNIAALLWLGATTGISLEIYNPGAIIPGVMGVICLILALLVSQVIPVSYGAVALLVVGGILIASELYVTSGVLGFAGLAALIIGSLTLIDGSQAPDLKVSVEYILPVALIVGGFLLIAVRGAVKTFRKPVSTGKEGLVGLVGETEEELAPTGRVFVNGEIWKATTAGECIPKGAPVSVVEVQGGLTLLVKEGE
jgi:membrane-bound serine protease (ClpP class)